VGVKGGQVRGRSRREPQVPSDYVMYFNSTLEPLDVRSYYLTCSNAASDEPFPADMRAPVSLNYVT